MKLFRILITAMSLTLLLAACSASASPESSSPAVLPPEPSSTFSTPEPSSEVEEPPLPVNTGMCKAHNPWYHSIPAGLLEHVGWEESNQWEREQQWKDTNPDFYPFNEGMNIENFIRDFHITKEVFLECVRPPVSAEDLARVSADDGLDHTMTETEYYNRYSFTDEQIDALFSGDQRRINEAFCGPLAFVNEADGELYSIYWLAEHTAADYTAAGLPRDKIKKIVSLAQLPEYADCTPLGDRVMNILNQASDGSISICYTHNVMYHFIDGSLIDYIGMDVFNAWIDSLGYDFNEWNSDENCNIVAFVEHFQISKETFISLTREGVSEDFLEEHDGITEYSMEQIDAIYSGDPKEVNRVFCGPLAVYNENDGQLYSLHWIADHTAEECVAMGLPLDQVQRIVENAQTKDYWRWNELGKEAETTLEQMEAIEASADAKE